MAAACPSVPSGSQSGHGGEEDVQQWLDWYMVEFQHTMPVSGVPDCIGYWITNLRESIRRKLDDAPEGAAREGAYRMLTKLAHTLYAGLLVGVNPDLTRKAAVNLILPLYEAVLEIPQDTKPGKNGPESCLSPIQVEANLMATCFQTETKSLCSAEIVRIGYAVQAVPNGSFRSAFNSMLDTSLPTADWSPIAQQFRIQSTECTDQEIGIKLVLSEFEMIWEAVRKLEEASNSGNTIESIINGGASFGQIEYKYFMRTAPPNSVTNDLTGNVNTRGDAFRRIRNSIAHTQYNVLVGNEGKPTFVFRNQGKSTSPTYIIQINTKNFGELVVRLQIYTRSRLKELRDEVLISQGYLLTACGAP